MLNGLDAYRSKEIIPNNNDMKKMNRISTIANINIKNLDPKDTVEAFYELFETMQTICDDINLYFGKQVMSQTNK